MTDLLAGTTPGPMNRNTFIRWVQIRASMSRLDSEKAGAAILGAYDDLATENATLRQENERLKEQNTRLAAYFSDHTAGETQPLLVLTVVKAHLAKDEATKTERDTLRSHLRDVVVPALESALELRIGGPAPTLATALHETQELLGDG